MKSLDDRLRDADTLLAPYATPHIGGLGRMHEEPEDATRFPFQRDRDRVIHTRAFRRLKGKTQVFIASESDHHRTRLTHTMEVAQISRDMARTMGLNEDLTECIALAHDLGHPPFGHSGEETLNEWMEEHGGRFEHNEQSYRIVTLLETHCSLYEGLNLNQEILEGLLKHRTPFDQPSLSSGELRPASHPDPRSIPRSLSLEAQVVNIADEIAYTGHDCEDGIRAELFSIDDLNAASDLAKAAQKQMKKRGTSLRGSIIDLLVTDLYEATSKQLTSQRIITLEDVYRAKERLVRFSEGTRKSLDALRGFLWENMYLHPQVMARNETGKEIVRRLCAHYLENPSEKVTALVKSDGALVEAIKDYVAGMTDQYAEQQLEAND